MAHNEDTRVKLPAILHLVRLGYQYLSLKANHKKEDSNIFTDIFLNSISRINDDIETGDATRLLQEISQMLENEDLGRAFYERLTEKSGVKLIDFEDFDNNSFHVVTELTYKNGEDEFRPDITLLINGMPLAFIEVKKPNNRDGVIAERKRMITRSQNKKFRKFWNVTQFMVFSNNMEYDTHTVQPLQGVFYAAPSYDKPGFNYFREEETLNLDDLLKPENEEIEDFVLKDNNLTVIKNSPEFITNKSPNTPTNRVSTSLFNRARLSFILQYAIAYVEEHDGLKKHIMRYPQIFATKAIERKFNEGVRQGIIWHTQGSGKTALAYFNVHFLTDYFRQRDIIPKFYFIVDRLDLLVQAKREFTSRGLTVHTVNSRDEFVRDIKSTSAIHNHSGKREITVVNIHKFKEDNSVAKVADYNTNIQRVYFLDEVHRSYNPKGSFLANLTQSDRNAIRIGLTGTPLIGDVSSKQLFGGYIHKYYYNKSISDGYTLKLIREEIETEYKMSLAEALKEVEILKGKVNKKIVYAHPTFVEPMLDYIIKNFQETRQRFADDSIGGMVVCDSSEQAKELYKIFNEKYTNIRTISSTAYDLPMVAEDEPKGYQSKQKKSYKVKRAALILHDIGSKKEREDLIEEFKAGKIDFVFVYNMLLTGFDAKRLKKLYLGRVVKKHNLLQTLTRVNRTYKDFEYGYVVDFADIRAEFDATNRAYFDELQDELGDEMEHYSELFKSKEEIEEEIREIKDVLFQYNIKNAEIFQQQISQIDDKKTMLQITKALSNAKSLYNTIRMFGHYELLEKIDFKKLNLLYKEANNHLNLLNAREALQDDIETTNLLNIALEDVLFMFTKVAEEELILADKLKNTLRQTREALASNFDKKDPEFVSLYDELKRLFDKKNLDEITQDEMRLNIGALRKIHEKVKELNRLNNLLKDKYEGDPKYARVHKRVNERGGITKRESQLFEALTGVKSDADLKVLQNVQLLEAEDYFDQLMIQLVVKKFVTENKITLDAESSKYINNLIVQEYINEFHGRTL